MAVDIGAQMMRKELTETFMMISNCEKNTLKWTPWLIQNYFSIVRIKDRDANPYDFAVITRISAA